MSANGAQKFRQTALPRQPGEQARLKVVQGPDYGSTWVLTSLKVTVGRGEDCDVMIADLKASRTHAEIALTPEGWALKDLGSANGVLHNGKFVRAAALRSGESITLGETTLEFATAQSGTMALAAPPKSLATLKSEQSALEQKRQQVRALGGTAAKAAGRAAAAGASAKKNPKLILVAVTAVAVVFFVFGDTGGKKPAPKRSDANREIASPRGAPPAAEPPQISRSAEVFLRAGLREYREHNWLRARTQFETVLQIVPGHQLATIYLENCNHQISDEVDFHMVSGRKSRAAGKLKEAQNHFEAVQRLLFKDQQNKDYKEAGDQLAKISREMSDLGLGGAETTGESAAPEAGQSAAQGGPSG